MAIKAKHVQKVDGFTGVAHLYVMTDHVVVSATTAPFSGPEAYIFPAYENGKIASWMEMNGSLKGTLRHEDAIAEAGWELDQ